MSDSNNAGRLKYQSDDLGEIDIRNVNEDVDVIVGCGQHHSRVG